LQLHLVCHLLLLLQQYSDDALNAAFLSFLIFDLGMLILKK
jgi:hypothetical protein